MLGFRELYMVEYPRNFRGSWSKKDWCLSHQFQVPTRACPQRPIVYPYTLDQVNHKRKEKREKKEEKGEGQLKGEYATKPTIVLSLLVLLYILRILPKVRKEKGTLEISKTTHIFDSNL